MEGVAISAAEKLASGEIEKLEYQPNRTTLEVTCPSECFLVLADLYLPGWKATIDGQSSRVYRTDAVVRGLFVNAGRHCINFVYRPPSVMYGIASMLITALLVMVIVVRSGV